MRLRINRRVRTSHSEQWTLYDADRRNPQGEMENIGKLDLHFDEDLVYATLLLWQEFVEGAGEDTTQAIIDDLMEEATGPVGVAALYSLDFFTPSLSSYKFLTNDEDLEEDEEDEDEDDEDEDEGFGKNGNGRSTWP